MTAYLRMLWGVWGSFCLEDLDLPLRRGGVEVNAPGLAAARSHASAELLWSMPSSRKTSPAPSGTGGPEYGPMTRSASAPRRSLSNSDVDPAALRGTQLAQLDMDRIAMASSGPLGRTTAIRWPRPNPMEWRAGPNSLRTKERMRACPIGRRPSMDARAWLWPAEVRCISAGMAETIEGYRGRIVRATSDPRMDPFGRRR
mmetsp:Transcript_57726/g.172269  ORF Transcript_57726/g.172269 Transcript_57726/m.172269 type:complete len:200 (+) Transcript_57726:3023-3622(+)